MAGRNGLAGFEVATALIIVEVLGQTDSGSSGFRAASEIGGGYRNQ
jgi:hypothetical protein